MAATDLNSRSHLARSSNRRSNEVALAPSRNTSDARTSAATNGIQSARVSSSHGYGDRDILRLAEYAADSQIDPELRTDAGSSAVATMMPVGPLPPPESSGALAGSAGAVNVAPALRSADPAGDVRKSKRELSQSKRAAQNRAAQRAFRQRKEGYIKKLEQQVREFSEMEGNYKTMQSENYALKEYVIHLQSRLLDSQGEYPQPPPNINLSHPLSQGQEPPVASASSDHASTTTGTSLDVVAQAVAGLARAEQLADSHYTSRVKADREDDARTAEAISRQLQTDGLPAPAPL